MNTTMNLCLRKKNYVILGVSALLITIGFALTCGEANTMDSFTADVFSFRRTVLGPNISLFGYILIIYGIMAK